MTKMTEYYINYTYEFSEFLRTKDIEHYLTEADIIVVRMDARNDSPFAMLILEFAEWLLNWGTSEPKINFHNHFLN